MNKNKKIIQNTLFLYLRTFLVLIITLYSSRIILNVLGVEDFGIYNVVGGVVIMLSFFNNVMASSSQRFFNVKIGLNDKKGLNDVFTMSTNIHLIISFLLLFVLEIIGVWFVNNKLNIPPDRLYASNIVFQFSVFTFFVNILTTPYRACVIAHEKMGFFSLLGILEVVLKLLILFFLVHMLGDKLVLYSFFVFIVSVIVFLFFLLYCIYHFSECKFRLFWERNIFKDMFSFAGWSLIGNFAAVTYEQGLNILLNIFFGPVVNAARSISYQVSAGLNSFISNFQTAVNPQITQSIVKKDENSYTLLIYAGSKYSFFLLLMVVLPIWFEIDSILYIWLKNIPDHTSSFCRIILLTSLIDSISGSLVTAVLATGKIKKYQIIVGGARLLILPLAYICLRITGIPELAMLVALFMAFILLFLRLIFVKKMITFSVRLYFMKVISKITIVVLFSLVIALVFYSLSNNTSWLYAILFLFITTTLNIYLLGMTSQERFKIFSLIKNKIWHTKL